MLLSINNGVFFTEVDDDFNLTLSRVGEKGFTASPEELPELLALLDEAMQALAKAAKEL